MFADEMGFKSGLKGMEINNALTFVN